MREIKFRAKRIDMDRWICGQYFTTPLTDENSGTTPSAGWFFLSGEPRHCIVQNMVAFVIDPKTLGQYTGLKDKNDKEIYEGDVVACESNGINCYEHRVVCYDSYQTKYKSVPLVAYHQNAGNGGWTGYELKYHNEIIGNIYENAELLRNAIDSTELHSVAEAEA